MMVSIAVQAIPAGIVQSNFIPHDTTSAEESTQEALRILALRVFIAFQAGGQVMMSQFLGYLEIPATVLTNAYSGLVTEKVGQRHLAGRPVVAGLNWLDVWQQ